MIKIEAQVPLHKYTTLKVGGPAEYFTVAHSRDELHEALTWARDHKQKVTVLGGGSNVLVEDAGLRGLVIIDRIDGINVVSENDTEIMVAVGSGVVFDDLVAYTVNGGWWGLENLSHIPGSVGATPIQNVGAYGVEVKDVIVRVDAVDAHTLQEKSFSTKACAFSYRNSFFKTEEGKRYIVTNVVFKLKKNPEPKLSYKDLSTYFEGSDFPRIEEIRDAVITIRSKKFPDWHRVGTAGSFFKNPVVPKEMFETLQRKYPEIPHYEAAEGAVKIPLGWVLDRVLKLRGFSDGNVGTYEGQALVLINTGNATAHDINAFAKKIEEKVFDATGIHIEREVTML